MNDKVESPLFGMRNGEFGMRNAQGSLKGESEVEARPEGVDVSNHQGVVGWQRVAEAGIAFAIPKASEGAGFTDPYFVRNVQGARAAGILCGAYHFLSHDLPARSQADHFLEVLSTVGRGTRDGAGLLLPAVDVEPDPSSSKALRNRAGGAYGTSYPAGHMVRLLDDFLTYMRAGIGQNLMIYTYPDWWVHYMGDTHNYKDACPLWLAAYPTIETIPGGWEFASFHQYSDNGSVSGCPHMDLDRFNGSLENLRKFTL